jgi:PAS domain S-box-containing protein
MRNGKYFLTYLKSTISFIGVYFGLFLVTQSLFAGHDKIQFTHPLKIEYMIYDILQDRDGFIWLATYGGLMRYDGYDLKVFKKSSDTISSNSIASIFEDSKGKIWICTADGGLNRYDKETNRFTVFRYDPEDPNSLSGNHVTSVAEDQEGAIWIGTAANGLNRFDPVKEIFAVFQHVSGNPESISSDHITTLLVDKSGILWIGTRTGGLNRYDSGAGKFHHYRHSPGIPNSISQDHIATIFENKAGNLWIGTAGQGLNYFNKESGTFKTYKFDPKNNQSLGSNSIIDIYGDSSGHLWVGTFAGGLNRYYPESESFQRFKNSLIDSTSLRSNDISGIIRDRSGILWVVCLSGEVEKYNSKSEGINHYKKELSNPGSLSDDIIIPIYQDREGVVWIGTGRGGLNRFNKETETFTHYIPDPADSSSLKDYFVSTMFEDNRGQFWVGTSDLAKSSLCIFDRKQGRCTRFFYHDPKNPDSIPKSHAVRKIIEDREHPDTLWMVMDHAGLAKYDLNKDAFRLIRYDAENQDNYGHHTSWHFIQDSEGIIWLATVGGGLERFDPVKETFTHFRHNPDDLRSIASDTVTAIHIDKKNRLWATSLDGLNLLNRETGLFTRYSTDEGLPSDSLFGILEDGAGNLWISTGDGIAVFSPDTGVIRVLKKGDGLQGNAFFYDAFLQTKDGEMWFGGFNGVNRFYPEDIQVNSIIPPVYLTALKQGGEEVHHEKATEKLNRIELDWQHNYFEFEYVALEFTKPEKNLYKYMLTGVDNDWFEAGNMRFGRYTGLPSGTFTLRVKGSNNDGVWNEKGASLQVHVTAPFWKSTWFYSAAFLLGGIFIAVVVFYILRLNREISERKRSEIALRQSEEQFSLFMDYLPAIVFIKDSESRTLYVNRFMNEMFGAKDWIGKDTRDVFPADEADNMIADDQEVLSSGYKMITEEVVDKQGEKRIFMTQKFTMASPGKPPLIGGISLDITKRKRAEDELNYLRNLLTNIVNSMPSVVIGLDINGRITQWNSEAEKLTRVKSEDALDRELETIFPEMADRMKTVRQSMKDHEFKKDEKVVWNRDGETRYLDFIIYPLVSESVEGAVIRIDDTTERVQMEEMMIQSEKMMSVGGLAAGMAHEINNPLSIILQGVQNIERRISDRLKGNIKAAEECDIDLGK